MNKENHYEKKRKLIQKQQQNTTTNNNHGDDDDDEQIKKTLNFLDSILDQYILDENEIKKSYSQIKSMDNISRQQSKQNFHVSLNLFVRNLFCSRLVLLLDVF